MKIGFVLDDGLDRIDGVQQYILTLGNWLCTQGHEVAYLVGETHRTDIQDVYSISKNIKVRFNGNNLSVPLPASKRKIKKILKQERFDILHVQVPYSPFMGAKVIKLADDDTAVIGTFHILPFGWMSQIGSTLLGVALRRTLKRFDRMISVSEPAADFASKYYRIKSSSVVSNLVDTAAFRPPKPKQNPDVRRILFLGRLVERKGCHKLLEALNILNQAGKIPAELVLNVCGDGPRRNELESYVARNRLSKIVEFHGYVSEKQKIEFMQNADVSVFPSLGGESFGIVLIEAMAAGGGVILAGDNAGYKSVLGSVTGSIVDAHRPDELADRLDRVMADKKFRKNLYATQQMKVDKFSVDSVGQQVLDIYKACQKSNTRR